MVDVYLLYKTLTNNKQRPKRNLSQIRSDLYLYLLRLVASGESVFLAPHNILLIGIYSIKVATNQLLMPQFPEKVSFMLKVKKKFLINTVSRLGLMCVLFTGLVGCSQFSFSKVNALGANVTPIRELQSEPMIGTTAYIQGKVERRVPLLKRQAYLINDSTGKIWAITNQTALQEGEYAVIKGKIKYQPIPIAGKDFGEVFLEEK
ncbi:MAG: hypothetical protein IGS49_15305 [Chlorogloeopsis fritschii C42_A2020_084]|nr:hypothetical protein [Chlorogloeopsis fritschii C42_A2020_084]